MMEKRGRRREGVGSRELQREVEQGRVPQTPEITGPAGNHPSPYFPDHTGPPQPVWWVFGESRGAPAVDKEEFLQDLTPGPTLIHSHPPPPHLA